MKVRRRRVNKSAIIMAVPSVFFLFLAFFGYSAPVDALSACTTTYNSANFTRGGVATDSSGTITLTPAQNSKFGSIWNTSRINLANDFCVEAEVFLGNYDGADGLAFVMQPNSVAAGGSGGGLGYMGITPSFAVEYDTYWNGDGGDLYNDHVALMKNGNVQTHNLWGVSAVDVGNIEDGLWRKTKIYWEASTKKVSVWLDRNNDGDIADVGETLFNEVSADIAANFAGEVYWGFTAATGGLNNLQQVRNIVYLSTQRVNTPPTVSTQPVVVGSPVAGTATSLSFVVSDDLTTQAQWSFTKTSSNTTVVPLNAISVAMSSATNGTITVTPATAGTSDIVITAADADGSTIPLSFSITATAAPTSLVVTSLDDTSSSGTLRWAITQANATSGGIYDAITFNINGVINLTSALPQITQSLTVTGNGRTQTVIDGNNLYRPFNVASSRTLTISDMTLKQGQATNGGLIYNGSGTVSATNVRFTGMAAGSAVFNNNAGSSATYTNSTFDYLNTGIAGDYGATPQLAAGTTTWTNEADSVFTNKTYVVNCIFSYNTSGINNYRFTKVTNSQFIDNYYGANVTGLNRTQILNSTFTDNDIGIYHNSWIPVGYNMGTDNRLISGNTFTTNSIAIYLDDTWNNSQKNQSWSTITGNSWDATGVWVRYYQWDGTSNAVGTVRPYTTGTVFAQSTNTFPDTIGAPSSLTAVNSGSTVVLTWTAPTTGGYLPERYAISLNTEGQNGWGLATGNVGDANALNTTYTIDHSLLESLMPSGTTWLFHVRSDNDTFAKYSANSNVVSLQVGTPPVTTTVPPVTTTVPPVTTTVPPVTTTVPYQPAPDSNNPGQSDNGGGGSSPTDTTLPPEPTPEPETESTVTTLPEETLPETESTVTTIPEEWESTETTLLPIEVEPEEPETEEVENPSDESTSEDGQETISDGELEDILDESFSPDADAENVGEVLENLFETDITDTQLDDILDAVFDEDVSEEVFTEAITTMLDADLTDEQLEEVLDSAFSEETSVENMVSALDAILDGPINAEDLEKVMDAVFDGDLSDDETIALVEEVLKGELTADEFVTVIDAIFDEVVTDEVLLATFETVLETELDAEKFEAVVGALESEVVSSEQVAQVVTLIIEQEGGIPSEQATELATSAKVLESVDGEQATEVFAAIVVAEVSEETGAAIAEALAEAPTEVKEAFEEEINVFAGVFDTYTALGSTIDVGTRRSVIAVNLVTSTVAIASATGAIPTPGSNSSPSSPRQDIAARREEEEPEEGGAIEGEGPDWIKSISIYKYENGVKTMDWKNFTKKFIYGVMGSGFTLAGAVVMYFTLSGLTQQIALWGTLIAFTCAMYLHMKEPEN